MNTQRDGTPSVTNMFLWQPIAGSFYAPCVDGDYDMSVIGHEYGHMIENRMIGKGFRRSGEHAGAMGEAFGDLERGAVPEREPRRPGQRDQSVRRGRLRDRQPGHRDPRLRDELADERRFPHTGAKPARQLAQPRRLRVRPDGAGGSRGRRDLDRDELHAPAAVPEPVPGTRLLGRSQVRNRASCRPPSARAIDGGCSCISTPCC